VSDISLPSAGLYLVFSTQGGSRACPVRVALRIENYIITLSLGRR